MSSLSALGRRREPRDAPRTVAVVLAGSASDERTATALRLAERILAQGDRVTVFAHDDAVALSAGCADVAEAVRRLLRAGVHGATLDWVVHGDAAQRRGVADRQVSGVVTGDYTDLWAFVRAADVVLAPGSE